VATPQQILEETESVERTAALAAWLQGLYRGEEPPVLVGGAAVELYTAGAYTTGDLDFVGQVPSPVAEALHEAGFRRSGRHWVHEAAEVFFEFPGRQLDEAEEWVLLRVADQEVRVVSPEALVVDRLAAWQFWRSEQDAVNALLVARATKLDQKRLDVLAHKRQVGAALSRLEVALQRWRLALPQVEELRSWASEIPSGS
jgi:hypothetical protein